MYTDGIYEAADNDGEEFGIDHLRETLHQNSGLRLDRLFPTIIEAARQHAEQQKLGDDICLLGFTLNGLMDE